MGLFNLVGSIAELGTAVVSIPLQAAKKIADTAAEEIVQPAAEAVSEAADGIAETVRDAADTIKSAAK